MDLPTESPQSAYAPPVEPLLDASAQCVQCSYNLQGLRSSGNCPECGTPIQHSLRGHLLRFASPDYIQQLRQGLSLFLNGVLLYIVCFVVLMFMGIIAPGPSSSFFSLVFLGINIMMLIGYWKYSNPDPGYLGREDPNAARRVLRISLIVMIATTAVSGLLGLVSAVPGPNVATGLGLLLICVALVNAIASLAVFFTSLQYTRWLATRIPDPLIEKRSRRYMWLLPVISIVGAPIFFIGPLIALVLYWNLLDRVRKYIKQIATPGVSPAFAPPITPA